MTDQMSIAVIGCGRMGGIRASCASLLGAQVRFVYDSDVQQAATLASQHDGCSVIASASDVPWDKIDAIFICTPPVARGTLELEAIDHRVPFLVEKPVGLTEGQVDNVGRALKRTPLPHAVGYMNRYRRSVQIVRESIADQDVLGVSVDWLVGKYHVPWWSEVEQSGGPLNEQATHIVDLARYLVGEIESVQVISKPLPNSRLVGTASVAMGFYGGAVCSFLYSCLASQKMIRLQVYTSDSEWTLADWDFHLLGDETTRVPQADRNAIFDTETKAFFDLVRQGSSTSVLCDFHDAIETQRVVDAMHRSMQSGNVEQVRLNDDSVEAKG